MDLFDFIPASRRAPASRKAQSGNTETKGDTGEPVESVTQLTRRIKDLLERGVGAVWVEGEISNHRQQASGHHYFTLKDAGAQLACVLFKGSATGVSAKPADGISVRVFGEISVYETRGQYQMIVRQVRHAGAGALQARFEALKNKLLAEGLFDSSRKLEIPRFPLTIAIITSPTGSVLQDMLHILRRRAPWLRILVCPVRVQGAGAAEEITAALRLLGNPPASGLPLIDTIVLARGGGSLEDLQAFNEESVARAVAECSLPVISAVGHETDFSISDFVADLRAPTPSAAAELLAPDATELKALLHQHQAILIQRVQQALQSRRRELQLISRGSFSRDPERVLLPWRQRLDEMTGLLAETAEKALQRRRQHLLLLSHQLEKARPHRIMAERASALALLHERLNYRVRTALTARRNALEQAARQLQSLGPQAILARGFSYTLDSTGKVVRNSRDLQPGSEFTTCLAQGKIHGIVKAVE